MGLLYKPSPSLYVTGFSDADWAGSRSDHQSTSGYCTFFGGNLVIWRSKKQHVVAHSSAEAKYKANLRGDKIKPNSFAHPLK